MLNEKKFLTIYEDFMGSGLTVREYCSNIRMNEAKFYYWKKKLNGQRQPANGFVPVVFDQKQTAAQQLSVQAIPENTGAAPTLFEITYPNGTSVKINGQANLAVLQQLLQLNISGHV